MFANITVFIKKYRATILAVLIILSAGISVASAADTSTYTPLAPISIPGEGNDIYKTGDFGSFLQTAFRLSIAASAALAVLMIIYGGIMYMSTELISKKSDAKKRITDALLGFFLAITCWLILNTINPKLTSFNINSTQATGANQSNNTNSNAPASNTQTPALKVKQCTVTAQSKINSSITVKDGSAGTNSSLCDGKVRVWEKVEYVTVSASAGRNGCYKNSSNQWCVDVFAGNQQDLKYIKTDCSAGTNYSICQNKKDFWEDEKAFTANCECI